MQTLSRLKANIKGDIISGYRAVTNSKQLAVTYGRTDAGAVADYAGSGYVLKLIMTNTNAADNVVYLYDDGTGGSDNILLFGQFLHQVDLREDSSNGLATAFTTKAEVIDFPEPGLFFNGNLKVSSSQSTGAHLSIVVRQAQ